MILCVKAGETKKESVMEIQCFQELQVSDSALLVKKGF